LYFKAKEIENIKIIRYEESLYYANVDNFKYQVFKLSGVNPEEINISIKKEEKLAIKNVSYSLLIYKGTLFYFILPVF
jgi:hypothetical protein